MPWEEIEIPWLKCPRCGSNHFKIVSNISVNRRVINTHTIYCAQLACTHVWTLKQTKPTVIDLKSKRRKVIRRNAQVLC